MDERSAEFRGRPAFITKHEIKNGNSFGDPFRAGERRYEGGVGDGVRRRAKTEHSAKKGIGFIEAIGTV